MATDETASPERGQVLVVDDNRVNRLLLERRLEGAGFGIDCAAGGQEALDRIFANGSSESDLPPFDAVVLDIMMPEIDGMEVLRRIRENHSPNSLPVIMATAKDRSEDVVNALREGANDYVTKPVDVPVLVARLRMQVEFRRTHIALEHAQRTLIEAAKMESIGRLAAGVAHEVKNPLYVLQMGVDYFELVTDPENEAAMKTLRRMQNAVDRANTIIRGMVDFSRSEELTLVEADLNELIQHAILLVEHEIAGKGITLQCELGDDLPPIPLDRTKLEQVMINLLSNACHAMDHEGTLSVRTHKLREEELESERARVERLRDYEYVVAVDVVDDGPGFPEDFSLKLFDPFFTTKPAGQGTGLGLSVTKTIVDLHGGHIEISNLQPRGAKARVLLGTGAPVREQPRFTLDPEAASTERGMGDGI